MKSGKLAKLFSVDIKTLYRWTDEYSEFFSSDAQGIGRTQREYGPQDMIVINTIMKLRQVAEEGALSALSASKPGVGKTPRDVELEAANAELRESIKNQDAYTEQQAAELRSLRAAVAPLRHGEAQMPWWGLAPREEGKQ